MTGKGNGWRDQHSFVFLHSPVKKTGGADVTTRQAWRTPNASRQTKRLRAPQKRQDEQDEQDVSEPHSIAERVNRRSV